MVTSCQKEEQSHFLDVIPAFLIAASASRSFRRAVTSPRAASQFLCLQRSQRWSVPMASATVASRLLDFMTQYIFMISDQLRGPFVHGFRNIEEFRRLDTANPPEGQFLDRGRPRSRIALESPDAHFTGPQPRWFGRVRRRT